MKISEEIKQVRDERQCSIFEAKNIVARRHLLNRVADAETVGDLKVVLRALILSTPSFTEIDDW